MAEKDKRSTGNVGIEKGSGGASTSSGAMQRSGEGGIQRGLGRQERSPFAFMRRMMDDMDRLFGEFGMGGVLPRGMSLLDEEPLFRRRSLQAWSPEIEVIQREGKLVVRADLPGLTKDDVRVNVEEGALTIEGERKSEQETTEGGVYLSERSYGSFQRIIALPRGVNAESCDARFDNGVLEVVIDLPQQAARKQIDVRSGQAAQPSGASAQQQQAARPGGQQPAQENGPGAQQSRH